jgi:uncharacterized UBP type Zn finger protein
MPDSRRALAKTSYKGVQEAMEWLLAHADDPDIDEEEPTGATGCDAWWCPEVVQ